MILILGLEYQYKLEALPAHATAKQRPCFNVIQHKLFSALWYGFLAGFETQSLTML